MAEEFDKPLSTSEMIDLLIDGAEEQILNTTQQMNQMRNAPLLKRMMEKPPEVFETKPE
jgi:hypothetical protein